MTKSALEIAREALEKWAGLIDHQYTGSKEAMSALQEADDAGQKALAALPHPPIKESPAQVVELATWEPIATLPYADDLVWLMVGDSVDGPRPMETDDYDRYTHWAPCEPPARAPVPQASGQKEVIEAAQNLVKVKGRYHSEQAYKRLEDAVSALLKSQKDAAISQKENGK